MKNVYFILVALILVSCGNNEEPSNTSKPDKTRNLEEGSIDERMLRHVKGQLGITAIEKFDYEIFKEDLNGDDSTDWIITVNLLDRAINEAIQSGNEAKMASIGYVGNYNYFFYMNGETKQFSPAIVVPSSPHAKLHVEFLNISSEKYKDFTVDSRIRSMGRRRYYTVNNDIPLQMCQAVLWDGLGENDYEAFHIQLEPGTFNNVKDIVEYKGTMESVTLSNPDDVYTITPKITSTGKEIRRWHYHPQRKMYYMVNKES